MGDGVGALRADVRSKLGDAWRSLGTRSALMANRIEALELDPLSVGGRPLLAAIDSDGYRHLLVPLADDSPEVEDSRSAGVQLLTRALEGTSGKHRYADLACLRFDLASVFGGLAADVCTAVVGSAQPGLVVARKLEAWRELFEAAPRPWTPSRLAGLFAELLVLGSVLEFDRFGATAWAGPLGEAQDFRLGARALEIKATISPEARIISIHGWDQLEPPVGGDLRLGWFRLRLSDAGRTVPDLVNDCTAIGSIEEIRTRLNRLGLPPLDAPELRQASFEVAEERWYEVDAQFPAIAPGRFSSGHVPAGVVSLEYRVDLDAMPQLSADRSEVVSHFLGRP